MNAAAILSSPIGGVAEIRKQKMNASGNPPVKIGLWRFSLVFYRRPGVADALIALQDGASADVNLLLFALWHGLSGRGRIDRRGVAAAEAAVQVLRVEAIEPLRALRRALKAAGDPDILRLRGRIKAVELEAEKAAQQRLARLAGRATRAGPDQRIGDAEANLALCLPGAAASGPEAVAIRREVQRFVAEKTGLFSRSRRARAIA